MAHAGYSPFSRTRGVVTKPTQLVLVAASGNARMLRVSRRDGNESLTEVAQMQLPAAHLAAREMVTDRTGRLFARSRGGNGPRSAARHGAASDTDPHTVEYSRFAKSISRRLDNERRKGGFDELVIIAAPEFLGLLRPHLSSPTRERTVREVSKDLVRASDAQILRSARLAP